MKNIKSLLILFFIISGFGVSYSQIEAELNDLMKNRVQQKIGQMNDNISYMADPQKEKALRQYYRKNTLNLFIGQGDPYMDADTINTGVKMETTSTYRVKPTRRLMKDYFDKLINTLNYSKVDIETTKYNEIKVSDLKKIDDDVYECTGVFEQVFRGYRDGKPWYSDRTWKRVKVYVIKEEVLDGYEFIVLLGDVTAVETEPV